MDMHRVDPAAAGVEDPDLRHAALRLRVDAILVEELAVDHPRTVGPLELKSSLHLDLGQQLRWTFRYREERVGYSARVGGVPVHLELQESCALREGDQPVRLAAIGLLQPVHEEDL